MRRLGPGILWLCVAGSGCVGPVDAEVQGAAAFGEIATTAKGGTIVDEGGGGPCGPDRLERLARTWDELPFAAGAAIYARVVVALVARSSGSFTDWTVDPIRIEVAEYESCDTITMVMVHELGHALRALTMDRDGVFPAGEVDVETGWARADQWATLVGYASWDDVAPVAEASCGADADHCLFATDELFAETVRSLFYPPEGSDAPSWCNGWTPCWNSTTSTGRSRTRAPSRASATGSSRSLQVPRRRRTDRSALLSACPPAPETGPSRSRWPHATMRRLDPHRIAEERSIALHRLIAERITGDPTVIARARARVAGWLERGEVARPYALAWADLLDGPVEALCAMLVDSGEAARALRQVTPFAGAIDPRTRWRVWREVARDHR